jgi:hypothetical protein
LLTVPRQDEALLEAYRLDEENKMARITASMKELGGGRYWDWKEKNIMKRLHELGIEEVVVEPSTGAISRRKRKAGAARREDKVGNGQPQQAELMEGWGQNGGAVRAAHADQNGNGQHQLLGPPLMGSASSPPQKLSIELESELFETLVKGEARDSPTGSVDQQQGYAAVAEQQGPPTANSTVDSPSESERVARQVCAQIMQKQHREHTRQ